jgi:3',5'-cyclic AMP phosphodiesterase CpdA
MDADGLQLLANFRPPRSELTGDGRCFSFAWGPVRIIALDCNTDRTRDRFGAEHPSRGYLVSELARSSEPWIIVASHFPMWSASRQRDRAELLLGLLPELQAGAVSLYLSGHDHCYQRFGTPDEGGTVLIVSGGGGKNLYDVRPHPKAAVVRSSYHWCSVATVGRELTVRSHGLDGDDIDSFQLGLPAGEMLARIRAQNPARASRIEALAR